MTLIAFPGRRRSFLPQRFFYVTVALRALAESNLIASALPIYLGSQLLFGVLFTLVIWRPVRPHLYFVIQTLLVLCLLIPHPQLDFQRSHRSTVFSSSSGFYRLETLGVGGCISADHHSIIDDPAWSVWLCPLPITWGTSDYLPSIESSAKWLTILMTSSILLMILLLSLLGRKLGGINFEVAAPIVLLILVLTLFWQHLHVKRPGCRSWWSQLGQLFSRHRWIPFSDAASTRYLHSEKWLVSGLSIVLRQQTSEIHCYRSC